MELVECLIKAGFTRHESVLYLTLCREGELTGYEAAKISGISRSNAYLALAGLVDKGGACRIESEAVRYAAVPPGELVINLRRQMEELLELIQKNAPDREESRDPYITISGRTHIIHKMKNMLNLAVERVYLSLSTQELQLVLPEVTAARERGLKVVVITDPGFSMEGITVYHHSKRPGQIRIIADSAQVLTGELGTMEECACLYSRNSNLIQLIKDSLSHEIQLIQMKPI